MDQDRRTPVGLDNEEDVVRLIASLACKGGDELRVGIGDDCAVLSLGGRLWCVTTDLMVEGVHFDLAYFTPYDLGRRVMAANLSDLAAMGADPRWGFLSLGMGPRPDSAFLRGVIRGLSDLGKQYGLSLAGGDTVRSPALILNLCIMGLAQGQGPLLRSGARPGDAICVTGRLGASAAGLAWLQKGGDSDDPAALEAVKAHLRPVPRVAAGRALAQSGRVHAMMDLSDGLATDLARLAVASQVGAEVLAERLPVDRTTRELAQRLGTDPLEWALSGGEDFELLFTCEPAEVELLAEIVEEAEAGLTVTRVGRITRGTGVELVGPDKQRRQIAFSGFDHFRAGEPA